MRLYQPEFLEVARKGGLSHAEFLRGQPAAQLFLISNPLIGHQAEDLTVTKSLVRVHGYRGHIAPVFLYTLLHTPVNEIHKLSGHGGCPMARDAEQRVM